MLDTGSQQRDWGDGRKFFSEPHAIAFSLRGRSFPLSKRSIAPLTIPTVTVIVPLFLDLCQLGYQLLKIHLSARRGRFWDLSWAQRAG